MNSLPQFDVLVVGAGAAGLYTALCLPRQYRVGLIAKDKVSRSASDWAQGGIAAVVDPQDSTELHIRDTLKAGAGLCDYDAVKFLVENAAACIHHLVDMGVGFDRYGDTLSLTLEAAHSRRRVLHAADTTGRAVVSRLAEQVLSRENIQVLSQALVLDVWLEDQGCRGVSLVYQGALQWVRSRAVILATGGGGQVFAQTTNPAISTGDGVAIAHRAGAILRDLEFVQFHPTALTTLGAPRFLISEAVRGEGAHLVDRHGHRFTFDYHPSGELAPRDVVSRAIFNHLQTTEADPAGANVWLDLRPIPPKTIEHRFPNIIQVCQRWGIDVFKQPIPVAPAAHYWMGGIGTDLMNQTSIANLYAVGETASTGVHGANRLASNSLLECLVFGSRFADLRLEDNRHEAPEPIDLCACPLQASDLKTLRVLRSQLPRLVWQEAGICRNANGLEAAIAQVAAWQTEFHALALSQTFLALKPGQAFQFNVVDAAPDNANPVDADYLCRVWGELHNLLEIADLILRSAKFRTESRGGHYRADYPHPALAWERHTTVHHQSWCTSPVSAEA
ncbi:L-aspartate oxidase [Myxacorys almedinensis]|uniref:L-aspartate oxidase n=1 Tax=Myxacorys almedinensis A TaxID=2690445 RepID=A0A8J8CLI4_9CYAN|nr:L-aspartate oxidase [Myxacorys almedinensis A]